MLYTSKAYRTFTWFNYLFLLLLSVLCLLPLVHIFAVSLSSNAAASANLVTFWPVGFTFDAYVETMSNPSFFNSIFVSIQRTAFGTAISMFLTVMSAYALSKEEVKFKGRTLYAWFFVFTILFNGGLIPTFLVVQKAGLVDTLWALMLPHAVNVWNMILMLNFFRSLPKELEESAFIDGANHFVTLFRIYLPISMPSIATLSLFAMVFHWNSWLDGLIYLNKASDYPLATFLQSIVVQENFAETGLDQDDVANISERTIKSAQIFIGALPILMVYPFLQKYFVKGIVLGSVKE
ncbi:carbohydrate ABC transporter permease [Paenibacillus sp. IB182496]|uniref:Carbohydrate ABC transporter permease n=1 Tax=Paenibacillus sabuli TaxID=2772509 RepID=A0A927GTQ3_9BACL|nr:carbohydrate ABC transporter permease [Paenibacillus sabuli]MBD2848099.1 carbohydrate ABC transporter permease [Paenibacillus sabuli]